MRPPDEKIVVDLETVDGQILPDQAVTQMESIANLSNDWSRIVSEEGQQLMTVGHHFKLSRALNNEERARIDRRGTCIACHQEIPNESLAVSLLHHVAKYSGQLPKTNEQHAALVHKITLLSAWTQAGVIIAVPSGLFAAGLLLYRRRRLRNRRAQIQIIDDVNGDDGKSRKRVA